MNSSHIQLWRWLLIFHKRAPIRHTGFTTRPSKYILASFLLNSVPSRFLMSYSSQELLPWTDLCPLLVRMLFLASSKGTIPPGLAWPGLALRVQCTVNSDVIVTDTNAHTHHLLCSASDSSSCWWKTGTSERIQKGRSPLLQPFSRQSIRSPLLYTWIWHNHWAQTNLWSCWLPEKQVPHILMNNTLFRRNNWNSLN